MSGQFVWFDLLTPDAEASKAFYTDVVGWTLTPFRPGYDMFTGGEGPLGGLETIQEGQPRWLAYVDVEDVDASFGKALAAGATAVAPPSDIPEVGRSATIADPHGAHIALFSSSNPAPEGGKAPEGQRPPGHVAWVELMAGDLEEAWGFYTELLGFTKHGAVDSGEFGEYRLFMTGSQGGGMMTTPNPGPPPAWLYYFNVSDLDAALERAKARGARVNHGPMVVPGGDRVVALTDPQGADFALHEFARA
ncbi:MAG: VOC family protein [Alphaproteobacteria bacterium]|nr:VOC family protein [Alphaproteobacteria bacterium]